MLRVFDLSNGNSPLRILVSFFDIDTNWRQFFGEDTQIYHFFDLCNKLIEKKRLLRLQNQNLQQ